MRKTQVDAEKEHRENTQLREIVEMKDRAFQEVLRENECLKKSLRETDSDVLRLTGALERQVLE